MHEQANGNAEADEGFRGTAKVRGGGACFTGRRIGMAQLVGYLRNDYMIARRRALAA